MDDKQLKNALFPHSKVRKIQEDLIKDTAEVVNKKQNLIAHAPTGLGKTAATISPCLAEVLGKDEGVVFFLTSRHTQHKIALDTLKKIKDKHNIKFGAVSIIGKKWMCAMPETAHLFSNDFISYCKTMRDDDQCEFYHNIGSRQKQSVQCQNVISKISKDSPIDTGKIISICKKEKLCPYEVAIILASRAKVIVTDYFYLLDPFIREMFLNKIGKTLNNSIIIFDEAHNIPSRTRDLMTTKLSSFIIERAIKEAKKYRFEEATMYLEQMRDILKNISDDLRINQEKLTTKKDFVDRVNKIKDYDEISTTLEFAADEVRETERSSYIGSVVNFLNLWQGDDKGYVRIISKMNSKYGEFVTIIYRCLDPSLFTKNIISNAHSTILMSGTLTPTSMYRDLLGFTDRTVEKTYPSPFPKENRKVLIVPKTTTKFTERSDKQYNEIAKISSEIIMRIPGNTAIFFPSYGLMNQIEDTMKTICERKFFIERQGMTKEEKHAFLADFMNEEDAVLLGVASGSFGEGVDMPDNILKGVIVVGLPLEKPSLETKELIKYYDDKFSKGWDYGYTMPAITRALQNAGRCIRSEKDKGILVFLDERYSWPAYIKCFPDDWDIKITVNYDNEINKFFHK